MATRIELPYPYEWRYLPNGEVRHALNASGLFVAVSACGMSQWSYWDWHGTGSMDEYERAQVLPDCRRCVRVLGLA